MVVDPGTAALLATAVSTAAKGAGDYMSSEKSRKVGKYRAKETKRETFADLLNDALQRSAELEAQRLAGTQKLTKRRTQSLMDSSDLIRGALNI